MANFHFQTQFGVLGIAALNIVYVLPKMKSYYRSFNTLGLSQTEGATHYVYMDIEVDGKDRGRLDFELFGKKAPSTVNNFLAFCVGDFNPYMRYKGCGFHQIAEQRFVQSGDFTSLDGTGSATVYPTEQNPNIYKPTMKAEENDLTFCEPYLLAMAANDQGETGS